MLKKFIVLISLVLISLMLLSSVFATNIDPLVLEELGDNGEVSVIVVLKDSFDLEQEKSGQLSTKSFRSISDQPFELRKQLIRESQDGVLGTLNLKNK
ncbi:hypothetical protein HN448_04650, partial [archaeon]|nr:hypothetical protein [archaeon]